MTSETGQALQEAAPTQSKVVTVASGRPVNRLVAFMGNFEFRTASGFVNSIRLDSHLGFCWAAEWVRLSQMTKCLTELILDQRVLRYGSAMPPIRMSDTTDFYRKARASMAGPLNRSEEKEVWPARIDGRAALVAIDPQALLVACPRGLGEARIRWSSFEEIKCVGVAILFRFIDKPMIRQGEIPDNDKYLGSAPAQVDLVTTNYVAGHGLTALHGDVLETVVRARNLTDSASLVARCGSWQRRSDQDNWATGAPPPMTTFHMRT